MVNIMDDSGEENSKESNGVGVDAMRVRVQVRSKFLMVLHCFEIFVTQIRSDDPFQELSNAQRYMTSVLWKNGRLR